MNGELFVLVALGMAVPVVAIALFVREALKADKQLSKYFGGSYLR